MKNLLKGLPVLLVLLACTSCALNSYAPSSPEKRYQAHEKRGKSRRAATLTKTFSLLAPEGNWTVFGPYARGSISFTGKVNPYTNYRLEFSFSTVERPFKKQELSALKERNFQSIVDQLLNNPDYEGRDPLPKPRKLNAWLVNFKGYTCVAYEQEMHQGPDMDPAISGKWAGQGHEEYFSSLSCDGFLNGVQGDFLITTYITVSDRHLVDGVPINVGELKQDLERRMKRSTDSLKFNGEFTQQVPAPYR